MIWLFFKSILYVVIVLKLIIYLTNARCKSKVCLIGKIALITGGNSGLGLQLAKELASRGCTIIIADKDDATTTVSEIIKETHNPNISAKVVDFSSFISVRTFAKQLKLETDKLHILVNNIGMANMSFEMTKDNIQKIMQVNYFSHFLLTHLLLDLLLNAAPSRIINTSSITAYVSHLSEQNLKGQPNIKKLFTAGSYGNSKVAVAIMSKMLANKLQNMGVTSNAFHPGFVKTSIWNAAFSQKLPNIYLSMLWTYIFGKNIDEGVQTLLHLSCADNIKNISGKFFMECRPVLQPLQVYDEEFGRRIWALSEKYVNLEEEEKMDAVLQKLQNGKLGH